MRGLTELTSGTGGGRKKADKQKQKQYVESPDLKGDWLRTNNQVAKQHCRQTGSDSLSLATCVLPSVCIGAVASGFSSQAFFTDTLAIYFDAFLLLHCYLLLPQTHCDLEV
jgi:hypothetical protein